jgi:DNA recombination protein RmuC
VVEFALRVPVAGQDVWLAIDAKFPTEDYDRLLLAAESGSRDDEAAARRALERRIRTEAARIAEKYIAPPHTVPFAVLYLPTDGLFAEVARTPGLIEQVRRGCRVMVMGPSLLPAFLHTVRVGHLTIALERRAGEIGTLLAAVKTEWEKLGGALDALAQRAQTLSRSIDDTRTRSRAVGRKLVGIEALPETEAQALLGEDAPA